MQLGTIFAALGFFALVRADGWSLKDTYKGDDFMEKFDYFSDTDPTHGRVLYQDEKAAKSMNLTYVDHDKNFVLRVDTEKQRNGGRPSVRLQSKKNYKDAVFMYVKF